LTVILDANNLDKEISCDAGEIAQFTISPYSARLLIWIINPSWSPVIDDTHQTYWDTIIYWFSSAKDIIFLTAWTVMSLLFLNVIVV
jgi:hypothetical protein